MEVPEPKDRPDYNYWMEPWQTRQRPSREEMVELIQQVEEYSLRRFVLGRRFKLRKEFHGIPRGTCCTVTREWPTTCIRWDKWATKGRGAQRASQCVSFEMDLQLEVK